MKTSFISSLAMQNSMRSTILKAQLEMTNLNTELTTGKHADLGLTLGANTARSLDLNRDIDAAAADVQAAISRAQRQLPSNMTTTPSYRKTNPADAPVLLLAVNSKEMPTSKLDEIAENIISPLLSTISGVAQVSIYGAQTYAVRIGLDPTQLQARGLGVDTVTTAIAQANNQVPVGALQNDNQRLTIDKSTPCSVDQHC